MKKQELLAQKTKEELMNTKEKKMVVDLSKRFKPGAIWEQTILVNGESEKTQKTVKNEFSRTEVRLTSGQVFSKIFLTKYYSYQGSNI